MEISLISSEEKVLQKFPGIFTRKPLSLGVRRSETELEHLKVVRLRKKCMRNNIALWLQA